jgi:two-component system, chemotaxis family, chemotaxis protein CheY
VKRILIVDDSRSVHAYLKNCFRTVEVELIDVYNGQEALDLFEKQSDLCDLVLLDWEMPVLDGPKTFEILRKRITVPVIMMTTKNLPSDIAQMLERGVAEYILKPFTPDILLEKVENVLGEGFSHV